MTKKIKRIFKAILYCFTIIVIALGLLVLYATIKQHAKDHQFVQDNLLPLANHVEEVKRMTGKLPTDQEFKAWSEARYKNKLIVYYQERPDFCRAWGDRGDAFIVGTWRGEWIEYYCSWNGKTFTGKYIEKTERIPPPNESVRVNVRL